MPKSQAKKPSKGKVENKDFPALAKEKIQAEIDGLSKLLTTVKTKFDKLDGETKKKIVAGVAGTAALIAGAVGVSKLAKKAPKKNK